MTVINALIAQTDVQVHVVRTDNGKRVGTYSYANRRRANGCQDREDNRHGSYITGTKLYSISQNRYITHSEIEA